MRLAEGDVFTMPVAEGFVAVGQVAWRRLPGATDFLLAIFEEPNSEMRPIDLSGVVLRPIVLQALSFDVLFRTGQWRVVGREPVALERLAWPRFKAMTRPPDEYVITDYTMKPQRRATAAEARDLPFLQQVSPITVEKAARAAFGFAPWEERFDALLVGERPNHHGNRR